MVDYQLVDAGAGFSRHDRRKISENPTSKHRATITTFLVILCNKIFYRKPRRSKFSMFNGVSAPIHQRSC